MAPAILTAGGTDTAGIQRMTEGGLIVKAFFINRRYLISLISVLIERLLSPQES